MNAQLQTDNYFQVEANFFLSLNEIYQKIEAKSLDKLLLDACILYLTNSFRIIKGIRPVYFTPELRASAQIHSQQMVDNDFFDHKNPYTLQYSTLEKRIDAVNGSFWRWGENLADFPTVEEIHQLGVLTIHKPKSISYLELARKIVNGWIGSPGHLRNLINEKYRYCASYSQPYYRDGILCFKITQNFGGKRF